MKKLFFAICALLIAVLVSAQNFSVVNAGFVGLDKSSLHLGDFDNDNDLDMILTGLSSGDERTTMLYQNDEGNYSPLSLGFIPVESGATNWGDYDADGDLDLLITGNDTDGASTRIYVNDNASFAPANAGLQGVEEGLSAWGDYDNDGDLDLVISGDWVAKIYRNDDGVFVDQEVDFGYYNSSSVAWGDFDQDGDLDLLMTGDSGAGAVSIIYRNDDGEFIPLQAGLPGVMAGKSGWVDFDNDSDLDIYLTGFDDALEAKFYLYRNDGHEIFESITSWMPGVANASVAWGDMDNDGDQDVAFCGKGSGCGLYVAGIYRNEGDYFTDIDANVFPLTAGEMQWADYDNDGDLDLFSTGSKTDQTPQTILYQNDSGNNTFQANTIPTGPTEYEVEVIGNKVVFSWNAGSDTESPVASLTYNIRVSTVSNSCDVWSAMAEEVSGFRRVIGKGNAGQNLSWTLDALPEGEYYWSIQAIDQAYAGSAFAAEKSFSITATDVDENSPDKLSFTYDAINKMLQINSDVGNQAKWRVFDIQGRLLLQERSSNEIMLNTLKDGVYIVHLQLEDQLMTKKISLTQ